MLKYSWSFSFRQRHMGHKQKWYLDVIRVTTTYNDIYIVYHFSGETHFHLHFSFKL